MTIINSEPFPWAPSSWILSSISAVLRRVRDHRRRRRALKEDRAAFLNMVFKDERILDDIGVTREEVLWAAKLPLEINAALAMREKAQVRRRSGV